MLLKDPGVLEGPIDGLEYSGFDNCASTAVLLRLPDPALKLTLERWSVIVPKLEAVIVLSPLPLVLGVVLSIEGPWFVFKSGSCDGVSTFNDGVLVSEALDEALRFLGSSDL